MTGAAAVNAVGPVPAWALRPAVAVDALCLQVLASQVFVDTYATSGIRPAIAREVHAHLSLSALTAELFAPGTKVVLAEQGEHLLGFAQLQLRAAHSLVAAPSAELRRLYVQSHFLRRGIGAALLRAAEDQARAAGASSLWLTAWVGNARALAFYEALGYAALGRTEHVFEGERFENRLFARRLDG